MSLFRRKQNPPGDVGRDGDLERTRIVPPPPKPEPRIGTEQLLAALVLHYANGEARFTSKYLEGLGYPTVEAHTEPNGTLVLKARR